MRPGYPPAVPLADALCPPSGAPHARGRGTTARGAILLAALAALGIPFYRGSVPLDLHVYLLGGSAVLHGHELYAADVQSQGYGFTYPPFPAVLSAPPSTLPLWVAVALMAAVFCWSTYVVIERSAPGLIRYAVERSLPGLVAVLALLACEPARITLWNGQINMVLAALTIYDLQRPSTACTRGALIGICTGIKLTPAIFVLYLLACRRFRDARNAGLAFAATVALAWAVVPRDSAQYWTHTLFATARIGDITRTGNQSLLALMLRETHDFRLAHVLWLIAGVLALAGGMYAAHQLARRGEDVLAIGVVGVTGCLLSPVSWTHHWVWFIPLAAGLVRHVREGGRFAQTVVLALAALFVIGCNKPPLESTFDWPLIGFLTSNGYVLAGVATIAALLVSLRRRGVAALGSSRVGSRYRTVPVSPAPSAPRPASAPGRVPGSR